MPDRWCSIPRRWRSELDLLGAPVLELEFSVDRPVAQVGVRLSDVFPDGAAQRASYAVFNLNHLRRATTSRSSSSRASAIARASCSTRLAIASRPAIACAWPLSTAYWPLIWPTPERVTLTVHAAGTRLELPVRTAQSLDGTNPFAAPESAPRTPVSKVADGYLKREVHHDLMTGAVTYVTDGEGGVFGEGVLRFDEIDTVVNHAMRRELVDPSRRSAQRALPRSGRAMT